MRFKMFTITVSLFCLIAAPAVAADITGTWVGEFQGGMGGGGQAMKITFNFKADGSTLTGTNIGPRGDEREIIDGKIDGDNVSFAVKIDMMGNEMTINYKGTVAGDEMKLTMEFEGGMGGPGGGGPGGGAPKPMELIVKRQP
jgi:opacity protein-like surface antigen